MLIRLFVGVLELDIPDYVNVNYDAEGRRVELSVKDREQRNQREMWGTLPSQIRESAIIPSTN